MYNTPCYIQTYAQHTICTSFNLHSAPFYIQTHTSSSSVFPSYMSEVHHFGSDFCVCDFFNPTIEVVTSCLRLYMLGVFLLPAFTHLRDMNVRIFWNLGLYSHPKELLGNGVGAHIDSNGKIPSTSKKFSSDEDRTHDAASSRTASPTHYQRTYSGLTHTTNHSHIIQSS